MAFGTRYAALRAPLYVFLWITAAILLGLTAFRINRTRRFGFHEHIIAELLAVSILTLLWAPFALVTLLLTGRAAHMNAHENGTVASDTNGSTSGPAAGTTTTTTSTLAQNSSAQPSTTNGPVHRIFTPEAIGWSVLWTMWLVGAAITNNKYPGSRFCGAGLQCHILTAIRAFAWIGWSLLTLIGILMLMQHAALTGWGASEYGVGAGRASGTGAGYGAGTGAGYGTHTPVVTVGNGLAQPVSSAGPVMGQTTVHGGEKPVNGVQGTGAYP